MLHQYFTLKMNELTLCNFPTFHLSEYIIPDIQRNLNDLSYYKNLGIFELVITTFQVRFRDFYLYSVLADEVFLGFYQKERATSRLSGLISSRQKLI